VELREQRVGTGSALVLGTICALGLNAVFRLGLHRTRTIAVDPRHPDPQRVADFLEAQGAAWGARRDVIDRASFNLAQSIETIGDGCDPRGPLEIAASFDEFNLDLRLSYTGAPLVLPETRPSNEEILASEEGQRKLAGFMLRRFADASRRPTAGGGPPSCFTSTTEAAGKRSARPGGFPSPGRWGGGPRGGACLTGPPGPLARPPNVGLR
jgi:hypothetical protein